MGVGGAPVRGMGAGPPRESVSSWGHGRLHVGLGPENARVMITGLVSSTRRSIAGRS